MQAVEPPVTAALVLVCQKCGKRLKGAGDGKSGHRLQSRIKKLSKRTFARGEIRVASTSCLNMCPENRISVVIIPIESVVSQPQFFEVNAHDIDEASDAVLKQVRRAVRKREG